jgi:hypothetical protein
VATSNRLANHRGSLVYIYVEKYILRVEDEPRVPPRPAGPPPLGAGQSAAYHAPCRRAVRAENDQTKRRPARPSDNATEQGFPMEKATGAATPREGPDRGDRKGLEADVPPAEAEVDPVLRVERLRVPRRGDVAIGRRAPAVLRIRIVHTRGAVMSLFLTSFSFI